MQIFSQHQSSVGSPDCLSPESHGRRRLLKLGAGVSITLPVFNVVAGQDSSMLSYHLVNNQITGAGPGKEALVLVDTGIKTFSGDGFYLYPDWGQPVVYEVRQTASKLTFHYPGLDQVLWVSRAKPETTQFSGRIEGLVDSAALSEPAVKTMLESMSVLEVPPYPVV